MSDIVYERLADALDRLPNRFPRTPFRVELVGRFGRIRTTTSQHAEARRAYVRVQTCF